MKVPENIRLVIQEIEVLGNVSKKLWNDLYKWFEDNNINVLDDREMALDIVANLQDGVGSEDLIKWLEKQ